jgi:hypothetical protein
VELHDALRLVGAHQVGVLVTLRRDGRPQSSTAVCAASDRRSDLTYCPPAILSGTGADTPRT